MEHEQQDRLDRLLAAYRESFPQIEPSPQFARGIWQKIEAEAPASWMLPLQRFAIRLVAFSTLMAAILSGALWVTNQSSQHLDVRNSHYVDALTAGSVDESDGPLWLQAGNQR